MTISSIFNGADLATVLATLRAGNSGSASFADLLLTHLGDTVPVTAASATPTTDTDYRQMLAMGAVRYHDERQTLERLKAVLNAIYAEASPELRAQLAPLLLDLQKNPPRTLEQMWSTTEAALLSAPENLKFQVSDVFKRVKELLAASGESIEAVQRRTSLDRD